MGEDNKIAVFKDALEEIRGDLEVVRAMETLEYHNRNYLASNVPRRSRERIEVLTKAIETLNSYLKGGGVCA